ncbi:hypothetical protein [Methanofollis fontis]|uniref:Uncharacterized protein n=1 Tax=Methanofollis fontis TaxID=2052832 RepID=A0A483CST7_9EURY|nr:hypothetical protein [Methanofollis fontis]TAJ44270.1 hypothetical protein CUJ86_09660 [Methanofollis fontis]
MPDPCFISSILHSSAISVLVAPENMLRRVLEECLNAADSRALYISPNYSRLVGTIRIPDPGFSVRRALTAFQVITILQTASESTVIIEYDRETFGDLTELSMVFAGGCRDFALSATVIICATGFDPTLAAVTEQADRTVRIGRGH